MVICETKEGVADIDYVGLRRDIECLMGGGADMKRLVWMLAMLAVLAGAPSWAAEQSFQKLLQNAVAATADGEPVSVDGYGTVALDLTLTGTAAVTFEGSVAGGAWRTVACVDYSSTAGTRITSAGSSGNYQCNVAGLMSLRSRVSSYTSGTVTVLARATTASGGGGGGGGSSIITDGGAAGEADVINASPAGTEYGVVVRCIGCAGSGGTSQADNSAVTNITGIGALYDTTPPAITDGFVGLPRMSSARVLLTDGSGATQPVSGPITDGGAAGEADVINTSPAGTEYGVVVRCIGCSGSGGTAQADESAFTEGTTSMTPIGGVLNDTITSDPTEDQAAAVRITAKRGLHVSPRAADGTVLMPTAQVLGNGLAFPTTTIIGAANLCSNGTTLDLCVKASTGAGAVDANTQRVTHASDDPVTTAVQIIDNLPVAQGSTTAGQSGILGQGAVTTSAPTYTTAQTSPLSLQTDGSVRTAVTNTVTVGSHAVTNAGTFVVQENGAALTALELIDNAVSGAGFNISQINGVTPLMGNGITGTGSPRVTIASDNTAFTVNVGTFPDNEPINVAQRGGAAIVAGACEREQPIYVPISQTAGTQLITGTASERIYVCAIHFVSTTAQNIALVDGTGTVCATGPTGLLGGATAATGWNVLAGGGLVLGEAQKGWAKTSTDADNVCLLQSGAGQVSGSLTYVSLANL